MDKKELKFYEAPASEVVELEVRGMLCSSPVIEDNPTEPTLPKLGEDEDL